MHVILGITSYERDTQEVKKYIENLKEVEYLREVKIYDIVCQEHNADFIADLLYPSSPYQKLYQKIKEVGKPTSWLCLVGFLSVRRLWYHPRIFLTISYQRILGSFSHR